MVICIFGVAYRDDADWEIQGKLTRQMTEVVSSMPGFISLKHHRSEDGDKIGIIRFQTRADLKAWRDHPAHREAWGQALRIYHESWVQTCETFDDYVWIDGVHHDRDQTDHFRMTPSEVLGEFRK